MVELPKKKDFNWEKYLKGELNLKELAGDRYPQAKAKMHYEIRDKAKTYMKKLTFILESIPMACRTPDFFGWGRSIWVMSAVMTTLESNPVLVRIIFICFSIRKISIN